jgi:sugar/nucleoside kinase (ribokinase family)
MLTLYGNLIYDTVKYVNGFKIGTSNQCEKEYNSIGAIGNIITNLCDLHCEEKIKVFSAIADDKYGLHVQSWLEKVKKRCDLDISDLQIVPGGTTTNALIISNVEMNNRTSILNWGECRKMKNLTPIKTKWSHILYADTLDNINKNTLLEIKKQSDVVSMDLCLGHYNNETLDKILSFLHYIDYLIISDVEARAITRRINFSGIEYDDIEAAKSLSRMTLKGVVIHSPSGSVYSDGLNTEMFRANLFRHNGINVLGAGDMFCSSMIYSLLKGKDMPAAIEFAHEHTSKTLLNRKENEKI